MLERVRVLRCPLPSPHGLLSRGQPLRAGQGRRGEPRPRVPPCAKAVPLGKRSQQSAGVPPPEVVHRGSSARVRAHVCLLDRVGRELVMPGECKRQRQRGQRGRCEPRGWEGTRRKEGEIRASWGLCWGAAPWSRGQGGRRRAALSELERTLQVCVRVRPHMRGAAVKVCLPVQVGEPPSCPAEPERDTHPSTSSPARPALSCH